MKDIAAWSEYCKTLAPAISEACVKAPVAAGPGTLTKELGKALPDWHFRHAFCRGGWYRLGGVVDGQGQKVADDLESWAEAALADHDGDFGSLADAFAGQDLHATRLVGRTHYLVSPAGDGTSDFLQLEIEALQEVKGHRLFDDDELPGSLEELIDPRQTNDTPQPLGLPTYHFRRLGHVGAFLGRMVAQGAEPAPIHRMMEDWGKSSAGNASAFYNHWVLAMREHLDRYQQPIFRAQPIATLDGDPPSFDATQGTSGLALQAALIAFDREAGYPMAWYFDMLAHKAVPHWVAQTVVEDALAGFGYLPAKDVDVVRHWLHRPYAV